MSVDWIDNTPFNKALPVWTRAYASELLPDPVTPLAWDLVWNGAAIAGWRDLMIDRMGFLPDEIDEEAPELIGVFGGYVYLNASLLRVWSSRTPALAPNHIDAAYFIEHRDMPTYVPDPWHDSPEATEGPLKQWLSWVLVDRNQSELEAGRMLSLEARGNRPDLAALTDGEVVDYALSLKPLCRALFAQHANQTLAASIGPGILAAICDEIGLPTNATALISGLGEIESASPTHALWTLSRMVQESSILGGYFDTGTARLRTRLQDSEAVDSVSFVAGFDALSNEVGFRAINEWEPFGPTWEGDHDLLMDLIDRLRFCPDEADPTVGLAQREAERETLVKEIGDVASKKPVTRGHFDAAIAATRTFIRGREVSKSNISRVVHEMRIALRELGDRAASRGDVADPDDLSMLFVDEVAYYADGGLAKIREIVGERWAHHERLSSLSPPFIIKAEPEPLVDHQPQDEPSDDDRVTPLDPGGVLFGKPGSSGVGRGRARIATGLGSPPMIEPGEVLIASVTPPSWVPAFVGAAAVVVEAGGLLSHATIICREMGIPMVVRAEGAADRIVEGALVEVDGVTGIVTVVEGPVASATDGDDGPVIDPWGAGS